MSDKMMRLAGRGAGKARALRSNIRGNLEVELFKGGINSYYYKNGVEFIKLEKGLMRPENTPEKSSVTKTSQYLRLYTNDKEDYAFANFLSTDKIDVSNIDKIVIDWENVGGNYARNESTFGLVAAQSNTSFQHQIKLTNSFSRKKSILDVSGVEGEFYLRIQSMNSGIPDNFVTDLRVYNVFSDDGSELKSHDLELKKAVEASIDTRRTHPLNHPQSLGPGEDFVLVTDFEFANNVQSWSFSAIELLRPTANLLSGLQLIVEYTNAPGEYYTDDASALVANGLTFRQIVTMSDVVESNKGLVTRLDDVKNGSNVILDGHPFNKPLGKYLRLTLRNKQASSALRLLRPKIIMEGNF